MSPTPPAPAVRLITAVLLDHRYRDAILGDLEEEFQEVVHRAGPRTAQRWYWRQIARSFLPLVRQARLDPRTTLRLVAISLGAYQGTLMLMRLLTPVLHRAAAAPGGPAFRVGYLLLLGLTGALAGYLTARSTAPRALGGTLLLLALTLAVGTVHVTGGAPGETGFRIAKVLALAAAMGGGALFACRRGAVPAPASGS